MKKLIVFLSGALLTTSIMAGAVTNAATWNVPWGDAWRSRAETTLDRMATKINADTAGAALGNTALQPGIVTVVGLTNNATTANVTVTNTLGSATAMVGVWSTTASGAASSANLVSIAINTAGVLISAADSPTVVFTTDVTGYADFTVTVNAASTNFFNAVQRDGTIKSSAEMEFIP